MSLIKDRKKNAPPDWLEKLPSIAMRLESSLLQAARSLVRLNTDHPYRW